MRAVPSFRASGCPAALVSASGAFGHRFVYTAPLDTQGAGCQLSTNCRSEVHFSSPIITPAVALLCTRRGLKTSARLLDSSYTSNSASRAGNGAFDSTDFSSDEFGGSFEDEQWLEETTKSQFSTSNVEDGGNNHFNNSSDQASQFGHSEEFVSTGDDFGSSSGNTEEMSDANVTEPQSSESISKYHLEVAQILRDAIPIGSGDEARELLKTAKSPKEVRHILDTVVYRNPLCFDVLNGHGYRVAIVQTITSVAPRTQCMREWFECVGRFRKYGFFLTRTFTAEGFTTIRHWIMQKFNAEGRTPEIVADGIFHIRKLVSWCREDRLVFDHVLYTRIVFLLTMIVSYFDRQNIFRSSFAPDFSKRDGVVVEWVMTSERCIDYDECVLQCDAMIEEVLEWLRQDIPSRPIFSIMYRLIDYYFATDNVEKMIATMEDAESYGIVIAESTTAKLMQLACALNYPNVPQLFLRWRASLPQCVIATPDISRLLFYYGRSGGGNACPCCGEPYNHRNVSVYVWEQTPDVMKNCRYLQMARTQKGELEEDRSLPQNRDWSNQAFALWNLSMARSIDWGAVEWRAFLLACMFSQRGIEAKELLDEHFNHASMDDFLRATYMRLLRHHAPREVEGTLQVWVSRSYRLSPIVLQEALMGAASISGDSAARERGMRRVWEAILAKDSYVMPFTRRIILRRMKEIRADPHDTFGDSEAALFKDIIELLPRHVSLLDMKDSVADFVIGTHKKNVYLSPSFLERSTHRKSRVSHESA